MFWFSCSTHFGPANKSETAKSTCAATIPFWVVQRTWHYFTGTSKAFCSTSQHSAYQQTPDDVCKITRCKCWMTVNTLTVAIAKSQAAREPPHARMAICFCWYSSVTGAVRWSARGFAAGKLVLRSPEDRFPLNVAKSAFEVRRFSKVEGFVN